MFKDDLMMSVLTGILLMVAVGTVVQRATESSIGDDEVVAVELQLVDDRIAVTVGQPARIDLLANDIGLDPKTDTELSVVEAPDCGWIAVQGGMLEYLTDGECVGERRLVYTLPGGNSEQSATLHISVFAEAPDEPALVGAVESVPGGTATPATTNSDAEMLATARAEVNGGNRANGFVPVAEPEAGLMVAVVDLVEPITRIPGVPLEAPRALAQQEAEQVHLQARSDGSVGREQVGRELVAAIGNTAIGGLGDALPDLPVDLSQPPLVVAEVTRAEDTRAEETRAKETRTRELPAAQPRILRIEPADSVELARLDPAFGGDGTVADDTEAGDVSTPGLKPAPRPRAKPAKRAKPRANCATPPSTAIDVMRAGRTRLSIVSPCHSDSLAELTYSGIRFAVSLDAQGIGEIMALGFEPNARALLTFVDGARVDFDLPFKSVDRVTRVALVWDLPVNLELNALEFGADPGSEEHVRPENRRSFREVRRRGGGFLHSFRARDGVGQNVDIYSHWQRAGGPNGIVKMMIDFASRNREQLPGTCGDGDLAAPQFLVMRSIGGQLERPILRSLAALDCSDIGREYGDNRLISDGIADLLIQ